ncbi:MAG: SAM hydroxide adenosyltransferase [Nitrospiraceae bacterium]
MDRSGNLISNITARQVREFRAVRDQVFEIHVGAYVITDLVGSYSLGNRQRPSALINSSENLEIFLQEDSAARCLQVGVGEEVRLC